MSDINTLLQQGFEHHRDGRLNEAHACYAQVLQQERQNPNAMHLMGLIERRQGNLGRGIELIHQALTLSAYLPGARENLDLAIRDAEAIAAQWHQDGRWADAVALYRSILTAQPTNAAARAATTAILKAVASTADAHIAAGRLDEGAEASLLLIRLQPAAPLANERLVALAHTMIHHGVTCHQNGQAEEAAVWYRKGLRLNPNHADGLYLLGMLERDQGNPGIAAALIGTALAIDPRHTAATNTFWSLATHFYTTGRRENAYPLLRRLAELDPEGGQSMLNAVFTAVELGRTAEALALCRAGLPKPTESPEQMTAKLRAAYFLLERTFHDDGIIEGAYAVAKALLARQPANPAAGATIAYYLYHHGRTAVLGRFLSRFFRRFSISDIAAEGCFLPLWYICRFDTAFFRYLPPIDVCENRLPAMNVLHQPDFSGRPVLFFCCDDRYWGIFGDVALSGVQRHSPQAHIHVHIIDPSPETREQLLARAHADGFGFSVEDTTPLAGRLAFSGLRRTYYASIRTVRLWQILHLYHAPVCQIDIDCIIQGDFYGGLDAYGSNDVTIKPGARNGPYNELMAGMVLVRDTPGGRTYLSLCARYITEYVVTYLPFWALDQTALYCTWDYIRRSGDPLTLGFFRDDVDGLCRFPIGEMLGKLDALEEVGKVG